MVWVQSGDGGALPRRTRATLPVLQGLLEPSCQVPASGGRAPLGHTMGSLQGPIVISVTLETEQRLFHRRPNLSKPDACPPGTPTLDPRVQPLSGVSACIVWADTLLALELAGCFTTAVRGQKPP
ncbi:unnamed protein product [Arctogadus glacialis]